jgi:hypothetical protein
MPIGDSPIGDNPIGGSTDETISARSTITIEMNCFTRKLPGVNVDSKRLIRLRTFTDDAAVYVFSETRALSSGR